jgi:hypothetical protein
MMEILQRDLGLKNAPVDRCHISSAQKLILSIVLEPYCNSYNRSLLRE